MNRDKLFIRIYVSAVIIGVIVAIALTLNAWGDVVIRTVCVGGGACIIMAAIVLIIFARKNSNPNR